MQTAYNLCIYLCVFHDCSIHLLSKSCTVSCIDHENKTQSRCIFYNSFYLLHAHKSYLVVKSLLWFSFTDKIINNFDIFNARAFTFSIHVKNQTFYLIFVFPDIKTFFQTLRHFKKMATSLRSGAGITIFSFQNAQSSFSINGGNLSCLSKELGPSPPYSKVNT